MKYKWTAKEITPASISAITGKAVRSVTKSKDEIEIDFVEELPLDVLEDLDLVMPFERMGGNTILKEIKKSKEPKAVGI